MLNRYDPDSLKSTKQRDNELIRRYVEHRDEQAGNELVEHYAAFLHKHARAMHEKYSDIEYEELLSATKEGFIETLYKFDPDRGLALSTYAEHWMKAEMREHISKNFLAVRLPSDSDSKNAFFKRGPIKSMVESSANLSLKDRFQKAAEHFGIPAKKIERIINLTSAAPLPLDAPNPRTEGGATYGETFADTAASPEDIVTDADEKEVRHAYLQEALTILNPREHDIFVSRRLQEEPPTLEELGEIHDLSKERIRQIEVRAFEKVQAFMLGKPIRTRKTRQAPEPA